MDLDTHIKAAADAMKRSEMLRGELRRRFPSDRDHRLFLMLNELSDARAPLSAHLRHAPKVGRLRFAPEVRAASEEVGREYKRVKRMRDGKGGRVVPLPRRLSTGGPDTLTRDERRRREGKAKRVRVAQVTGTVFQAKGVLRGLQDAGTLDSLAAVKSPDRLPITEFFDWTGEARAVRDEARSARLRIGAAVKRYKLSNLGAGGESLPRTVDADAVATQGALHKIERRAARMAKVQRSEPVTPKRRKYHRWTEAEARTALDGWAAKYGQRPSARQLAREPALPSWGTLSRLGISLGSRAAHSPAQSLVNQ